MIGILASVIDGVLVGSVYGLAAMGLTLIWGVMNVINLAHGAIIVLGMFVLYLLANVLGLPPYGAIPVTIALGFVFGVALYWIAVHRMIGRPILMSLLPRSPSTWCSSGSAPRCGPRALTTSPWQCRA